MKIWFALPFAPTDELVDFARVVEGIGLDGLALPEHLLNPATLTSPYPYSADHSASIPFDAEFPDPLVLFAAMGVATTTLRFVTYVLLAPIRHPLLLAKQAATASVVTDGRVELGLGVGWMREEFDALDVPFESRGARMDEMLGLLRQLWSGEVVEHHGEHFDFDSVSSYPVPRGPIPIFIGGESPAAVRRAARFGDGWIGVGSRVEQLQATVAALNDGRRAAGTLDRPFEIRTQMKGALTEERMAALHKLPIDSLVLSSWHVVPSSDPLRTPALEHLVRELPRVLEQVHAA
jgi:probable F420-dependent oxidoreductase